MSCLVFLCVLFLASLTSAGLFDWFGNITGRAVSDTTTLSITVGNNVPTVSAVQAISSQTPSEVGIKTVTFNFNVTDADGVVNINDSSAAAQFERGGETTRLNTSCVWVTDHLPNTAEYTCSIDMLYFDGSGSWTVNASGSDINDAEGRNTSTSFTYTLLTSMVMSPTAMAWPALSLTDTDTGSNNDPVVVNNTGNAVGSSINITGLDLQGVTITSEYIYSENFSVGIVTEGCSGTVLVNDTSTGIASSALEKGNNSINAGDATSGQEELFFCLKGLPQEISSQDYSSAGTGPWTIMMV